MNTITKTALQIALLRNHTTLYTANNGQMTVIKRIIEPTQADFRDAERLNRKGKISLTGRKLA